MKLRGGRCQLRELLNRAGINTAREQQRTRQNYRETGHHPLLIIPPPGWLWFQSGSEINVTPQKCSTQHVWVGNSPDLFLDTTMRRRRFRSRHGALIGCQPTIPTNERAV